VEAVIKKLEECNMARAKTKAALLAAALNRSVMRHSLKEHYLAQMAAKGEKVTIARIDDLAVADKKYQDCCQAEVTTLLADGQAEAAAQTALCEYEVAMKS